jgi:hypothetical protein
MLPRPGNKEFPREVRRVARSLPKEIEIRADKELATLEADPIEAQVSFEVVNEEIDWFDLKVVVKVDGMDLSQEEIRALVQARGQFVRMESRRMAPPEDESQR